MSSRYYRFKPLLLRLRVSPLWISLLIPAVLVGCPDKDPAATGALGQGGTASSTTNVSAAGQNQGSQNVLNTPSEPINVAANAGSGGNGGQSVVAGSGGGGGGGGGGNVTNPVDSPVVCTDNIIAATKSELCSALWQLAVNHYGVMPHLASRHYDTQLTPCNELLDLSLEESSQMSQGNNNVCSDIDATGPVQTAKAKLAGCQLDTTVDTWVLSAKVWAKQTCLSTPLVLDLGGDGIRLTSLKQGVVFDILADGLPRRVAWIQDDDALLVRDRNENGKIDDATELFGSVAGGVSYDNGFAALAEFDGTGDGVVDARDPQFSRLLLWQDRNQDGVSSPSELRSLADVGITQIDIHPTEVRSGFAAADGRGNEIRLSGRFLRSDNRVGEIVDAFLQTQMLPVKLKI